MQGLIMRLQHSRQYLFLSFLKVMDILMMMVSLAVSFSVEEWMATGQVAVWDLLHMKITVANLLLLAVFIGLWHLICLGLHLYDAGSLERHSEEWMAVGKAALTGSMVLLAATVAFQRDNVSKEMVLLFATFSYLFTGLGRLLIQTGIGTFCRHRSVQRLVLVGSNDRAGAFASRILARPSLGYDILGYVDDPHCGRPYATLPAPLKALGRLQDFAALIDREQIDAVVVALPIRSCYEQIQQIIAVCEVQGIPVHLLSDFFPLKMTRARATECDGVPMLSLTSGTSEVWQLSLKRSIDVVAGLGLLVLFAPLLLLTALAIKISSPEGPVLFRQTRVGYNRRHFTMLKFRTMVPHAEQLQAQLEALNEAQGPVFKIAQDPRVTPLGRFLRKTSLDELPQLFNVIKGDMSLVGPRPLPVRDVERFAEAWLKRRFSVKPGLTCLWQVNGRSNTAFDKWIEQDLAYIDHWSFRLDAKILMKTVPAVLRGTGAQ
jgi:exopolysaccharide biosynthesis polyprenyl glycosylphosphotransferase